MKRIVVADFCISSDLTFVYEFQVEVLWLRQMFKLRLAP